MSDILLTKTMGVISLEDRDMESGEAAAGAIKNLGYKVSASTVANIMRRNGFNPSGDRTKGEMSWLNSLEFIR